MTKIINNASGTAANGDSSIWQNPDPKFVQQNPLTTVSVVATAWDGASCQVYIQPSLDSGDASDPWLAVGNPLTANGMVTFSAHYNKLKITTSGALAGTSGLSAWVM